MLHSKQISILQCNLCVVQPSFQAEVKKTQRFTSDAAQDLLVKGIKSTDVEPENKKTLLRTPVRKNAIPAKQYKNITPLNLLGDS